MLFLTCVTLIDLHPNSTMKKSQRNMRNGLLSIRAKLLCLWCTDFTALQLFVNMI